MRQIVTYQDAVEKLLDDFDFAGSERERRLARSSLAEALQDIVAYSEWSWYDRNRILHLNGSYDTGTVVYDHTGGTYERQLTLTTGTWPDWAANGTVVIASRYYDVEQRISSTVVTLREGSNPGEDVASSAYRIDQYRYDLPEDFHSISEAWDVTSDTRFTITPGAPITNLTYFIGRSPGQPLFGTIAAAGSINGKLMLCVSPPPDSDRDLSISYRSHPRELKIESEQEGTVTATSGSTTIAGTSTEFNSSHVGAILRLSPDAISMPTNLVGYRSIDKANPYSFQTTILRVASATSIVVADTPTATLTGVKFTISDPIDVAQDTMLTALYEMARFKLTVKIKETDRAQAAARSSMIQAVRDAMGNDGRTKLSSGDVSRLPSTSVENAT